MGSNPIERKTGTMAWRVENVRVELGFNSQEEFKVYLATKFRGSAYTNFLRYTESGNPTLKEAAFVEDRLERMSKVLPSEHMEYIQSGEDGPVPKKPDDFDAKTEYEKAIQEYRKASRKKQSGKARADSQSMARHFQRITKDDDNRGEGFFSPKEYLHMLLQNSVPFGIAVQMAMYELEIRGEFTVVPLFKAAQMSCESMGVYGGETLALEAGSAKRKGVEEGCGNGNAAGVKDDKSRE